MRSTHCRIDITSAGTIPVTHSQVTGDDTMPELGVKVLGNTASAVLQVRDHLNRDTIDSVIDLLNATSRIDFYGTGHYGVAAQDAQFKFLRLGVSCMSHTDTRIPQLASNVVEPGVAVMDDPCSRHQGRLDVGRRANVTGCCQRLQRGAATPLSPACSARLTASMNPWSTRLHENRAVSSHPASRFASGSAQQATAPAQHGRRQGSSPFLRNALRRRLLLHHPGISAEQH